MLVGPRHGGAVLPVRGVPPGRLPVDDGPQLVAPLLLPSLSPVLPAGLLEPGVVAIGIHGDPLHEDRVRADVAVGELDAVLAQDDGKVAGEVVGPGVAGAGAAPPHAHATHSAAVDAAVGAAVAGAGDAAATADSPGVKVAPVVVVGVVDAVEVVAVVVVAAALAVVPPAPPGGGGVPLLLAVRRHRQPDGHLLGVAEGPAEGGAVPRLVEHLVGRVAAAHAADEPRRRRGPVHLGQAVAELVGQRRARRRGHGRPHGGQRPGAHVLHNHVQDAAGAVHGAEPRRRHLEVALREEQGVALVLRRRRAELDHVRAHAAYSAAGAKVTRRRGRVEHFGGGGEGSRKGGGVAVVGEGHGDRDGVAAGVHDEIGRGRCPRQKNKIK